MSDLYAFFLIHFAKFYSSPQYESSIFTGNVENYVSVDTPSRPRRFIIIINYNVKRN